MYGPAKTKNERSPSALRQRNVRFGDDYSGDSEDEDAVQPATTIAGERAAGHGGSGVAATASDGHGAAAAQTAAALACGRVACGLLVLY